MRKALWISIIVLLSASVAVYFGAKKTVAEAIAIDTEGQPTIGNPKAPLHIVSFVDPKCIDCKRFHNTLYPTIKEKYIDTNKARYTVIPLAFLSGSMPASIALLCVYHQSEAPNAELFMDYLTYLYANQPNEHSDWTTDSELLAFAKKASPAILLPQLKQCIDTQTYHDQIAKNTDYERTLIGRLQTPVLFINGIRVEKVSGKAIDALANKLLEDLE